MAKDSDIYSDSGGTYWFDVVLPGNWSRIYTHPCELKIYSAMDWREAVVVALGLCTLLDNGLLFVLFFVALSVLGVFRLGAVFLLLVVAAGWGVSTYVVTTWAVAGNATLVRHLPASFPYIMANAVAVVVYWTRSRSYELSYAERVHFGRGIVTVADIVKQSLIGALVRDVSCAAAVKKSPDGKAERPDTESRLRNSRLSRFLQEIRWRCAKRTLAKAPMTVKEAWSILELTPDATPFEIKARYRSRMKQYHPDKLRQRLLPLSHDTSARCAKLSEAYHLLIRGK